MNVGQLYFHSGGFPSIPCILTIPVCRILCVLLLIRTALHKPPPRSAALIVEGCFKMTYRYFSSAAVGCDSGSHPRAPYLTSFPPLANTEGRNNKMCFLKGRRSGKSPSCPENHRRPSRSTTTGLSAEPAKLPQEGVSANPNRTRSPLCGPPVVHVRPALGFLRARCSWSTLNKGNGDVTATVN